MSNNEKINTNSVKLFVKKSVNSTRTGVEVISANYKKNKHYFLPVLNGLIGDKFPENKSNLSIKMAFRQDGQDSKVDDILNWTDFTDKIDIYIFMHGLMDDETTWFISGDKMGYGDLLSSQLDITPLYVRYNTGLHISDNGKKLNNLVDDLFEKYKDKIKSLNFIGHSMGALIVRSAMYYANRNRKAWINSVNNVVLLGAPNEGTNFERFGHLTTIILKNIFSFHTKLIAKIIDERSSGIKDLRWGFIVEDDWKNPDKASLIPKKTFVPPYKNVKYFIVAGTIANDSNSFIGTYFGDGLVTPGSAKGVGFETANRNITFKIFSEKGHVKLVNDEDVYQFILKSIS